MTGRRPSKEMDNAVGRAIARAVARYARQPERRDLVQSLRLFMLERGSLLIARFAGRSSLYTYLTRVLEKQAITLLRAHLRRRRRLVELAAAERVAAPLENRIDAIVLERERLVRRHSAARQALAALQPGDRTFFLRAVLGAETMDEIARDLGISRAAAYSRSRRLCRKLRTLAVKALASDPIRSDRRRKR